MTKLNEEIHKELKRVWKFYSINQLCKKYKVTANTLWNWKNKLELPKKSMGRPNVEVRTRDNNFGLDIGSSIICLKRNKFIFGKVIAFAANKEYIVVKTEEGDLLDLPAANCKLESEE